MFIFLTYSKRGNYHASTHDEGAQKEKHKTCQEWPNQIHQEEETEMTTICLFIMLAISMTCEDAWEGF